MTKVSIIMATVHGRNALLWNTLKSWSKITYPNYEFILIDNGGGIDPTKLKEDFPFITKIVTQQEEQVTRAWAREGKACSGEYVIFAMAEELLGNYDIVQQFLASETKYRSSVLTYFLDSTQSSFLENIDWLNSPKLIETLPGFWDHTMVEKCSNRNRTAAGLISHITGAWRTHWDWFGWFRDDEHGYMLMDQDVRVREEALKIGCDTVPEVVCYHQWHSPKPIPVCCRLGGHIYENEMQARLLEPTHRRS